MHRNPNVDNSTPMGLSDAWETGGGHFEYLDQSGQGVCWKMRSELHGKRLRKKAIAIDWYDFQPTRLSLFFFPHFLYQSLSLALSRFFLESVCMYFITDIIYTVLVRILYIQYILFMGVYEYFYTFTSRFWTLQPYSPT